MNRGRRSSLPLGADLTSEAVSLVRADVAGDGFSVRETGVLRVPKGIEAESDLAIAAAIRSLLKGFRTDERRCILAAPASEVVYKMFRIPPGMRRREAERAAALEADTLVPWSTAERLVALDTIPGRSDELLLSVARASAVERIVSVARAGGLRPVAVDLSVCVWRRAVPAADAILDNTRERAELVIFGELPGTTHLFPPRLIDERLATQVRASLVEARRDGVADVRLLSILAPPARFAALEALLCDDGYAIAPVVFGGFEAPEWTFAYGLATWSVAPLGLHLA